MSTLDVAHRHWGAAPIDLQRHALALQGEEVMRPTGELRELLAVHLAIFAFISTGASCFQAQASAAALGSAVSHSQWRSERR